MTGVAGQIVLGQAAFVGIGAYTTGLLLAKGGAPWVGALAAGIALSGVVGAGVGVVSTRIKGHYLAITTLGLNEIFRLVVLNEAWATGGPLGLRNIPRLHLPALGKSVDQQLCLPLLVVTLGCYALAVLVYRSRYGRDMRAVRDDETAAEVMGVDPRATKVCAFVLSSALAGTAGGLYVLLVGFVAPGHFTIAESIRQLLIVVVGGLGSIPGTFVASLLLVALPEILRAWQDYYLAAYGAAILAVLLGVPRGLGALTDWMVAPWVHPRPAAGEPGPVAIPAEVGHAGSR